MFGRILSNTRKQISRSGWVGWASVSVMTLAFLVAIIFGGLAYVSNLYIQFIETKSNLLVFFDVGVDRSIIDSLKEKWTTDKRIKDIAYTTEEQAYEQYSDYTAKVQPEIYEVLKTQEQKRLPSSLDIQIWSLEDLEGVKSILQTDIEGELEKLKVIPSDDVEEEPAVEGETTSDASTETPAEEVVATAEEAAGSEEVLGSTTASQDELRYKYATDPTQPPITLRVDDENLDQLRQVLFSVRIAGITIITLLFIVIFFFTFMTVEFRLYNQVEEIGVMQLVGGSLLFIRAPYILEGGFYGFMGAFLAALAVGGVLFGVFVADKNSALAKFVYENFNMLPWPHISSLGWAALVVIISLTGFVLGSVISFLSIKRYIR